MGCRGIEPSAINRFRQRASTFNTDASVALAWHPCRGHGIDDSPRLLQLLVKKSACEGASDMLKAQATGNKMAIGRET